MLKILISLTLVSGLFGAISSHAASHSVEEFCAKARDFENFREEAHRGENRLAFQNPSGPLSIGSCWWHARLQRSALYLTIFRPDLPKPTTEREVRKIVESIAQNKEVTIVPGYRDLEQFTGDWYKTFEKYLARWELWEIFAEMKWIYAIRDKKISAERFEKTMNELHKRVEVDKEITFIVIRSEGSLDEIHGILITGMEPTSDGYRITYIDSNAPYENGRFDYRRGDTVFNLKLHGTHLYFWGAPHIQQNGDLKLYRKRIKKLCGFEP